MDEEESGIALETYYTFSNAQIGKEIKGVEKDEGTNGSKKNGRKR